MELKNSPVFHLIVGILWTIACVVSFIEAHFIYGIVCVLYAVAAVFCYIRAAYLHHKYRQKA